MKLSVIRFFSTKLLQLPVIEFGPFGTKLFNNLGHYTILVGAAMYVVPTYTILVGAAMYVVPTYTILVGAAMYVVPTYTILVGAAMYVVPTYTILVGAAMYVVPTYTILVGAAMYVVPTYTILVGAAMYVVPTYVCRTYLCTYLCMSYLLMLLALHGRFYLATWATGYSRRSLKSHFHDWGLLHIKLCKPTDNTCCSVTLYQAYLSVPPLFEGKLKTSDMPKRSTAIYE